MKKMKLLFVLGAIIIAGAIFHSCQKETPDNQTAKGSKMVLGNYTDCTVCIDLTADPVVYYEKADIKTVNWGIKATPFSKDVDIIYYNTEDNFVLKVRSTNGWSDLIIDEVSSWTNGPVAPNVYGEYIVPLPVGWQACDDYNFTLQVAGNGPQAVFDIEYKLIGVCCVGCPATVTDIDNNVYNVVKIGDQCWMKENLRTTKYNDGLYSIPHLQDAGDWADATSDGYCWDYRIIDNETEKAIYGAMYNWYAVNTEKLCPTGWRVPSDNDWKELEIHLGMSQTEVDMEGRRGTDEGDKMKVSGDTYWYGPWGGTNYGNNSSGFSAVGASTRQSGAQFNSIKYQTIFWSSTENSVLSGFQVYVRTLDIDDSRVSRGMAVNASMGFSVRCLKDDL